MLKKMKKICLAACSLLSAASIIGGIGAISAVKSVDAEVNATPSVTVDTETKSAWETAGYGSEGYIILGSNASKEKVGYSNMYTEYGNDGKTEIAWYRHGNSEFYYEEYGNGVDDTAPIGKWAWLGQTWSYFNTAGTYSGRNSYLYAPGTTTEYGWRLHNTNASPNRDTGFSFELRDVGSINASVYVTDAQSEWNKVDYTANPITVSLYKTKSLFQTTANDNNKPENVTRALEDYYGEAVAETTVTTNNVYVTFELNEPDVYTIVAYYKNSNKDVQSYILPSTMGLFFDKDEGSSAPTPEKKVQVDAETKSAWESAGYGADGYLVLGGKKAYSNLYTEPDGNNGKTEITLYHAGDKSVYYDSANTISTDSTAPISKLVLNDGSNSSWSDATKYTGEGGHWANQPDLYIPGTETKYPVRTTNGNTDPYHDRGIGFTLRETGKIYVTVYVLDWAKKVSDSNLITVGLFRGFKNTTFYGYGTNKATTLEEHYGTPIVKTTVTSQGAYVTFEIEGAGDYQIVCYYDNQGTDNAPVTPMPTGLFFDIPNQQGGGNEGGNEGGGNEGGEEGGNTQPPVLPPIPAIASIDTETKSAWETAGYGADGYFIFGRNQDGGCATYSDLYAKQGNDGKTEISLYRHGDNTYYYSYNQDAKEGVTVDETAPISKLIINGSSQWKAPANAANHLYIPGTETTYPLDLYNNVLGLYNDLGVGFTLRPAAKTYVTVYVMDRAGKVGESAPITVALYNKIMATTLYGYGNNTAQTLDEHYGTPLAKVAVTENGTYVTFEIDGGGDYQIVAYYDNQGDASSPVQPMMTGLFFERETGTLANLTYNLDGGENGPNPKTYVIGKGARLSDAFKDDYTFDGWFTDGEYTNQVTEISTEQTGDLTLYAKFTRSYREYTIHYETNGGEHPLTPNSYVWGVGATLTDATKDGYTFVGWYYDNEVFLERALEISSEQKGDVTLYARFVKNPTVSNITYQADGGVHTNPATYTEGETVSLADAAKEGYTFLGWYTDSECTNLITEISAEQTGDITLYAKFAKIPQSFAVSYVVDGGTHFNPEFYTEGTLVVLSDAIKAGYTFDGWYTDSSFENKVTEISAEQTGDITLYAKFTEIVVPDDGDGDSSDDNTGDSSNDSTDSSTGGNSGNASNGGESENSGGCFGMISLGGVGVLSILLAAGALIAKKKED